MSHHRLANAIKRASTSIDSQIATHRAGTITSVGEDGTSAKVSILPDGVQTGWLPLGHLAVGANAFLSPPNVGDLVQIAPQEGDAENWVITHRLFSTQNPAPKSPATNATVKAGELAIIMSGGAYLHFTADGQVHLGGTANMTITTTGTLNVNAPTINLNHP